MSFSLHGIPISCGSAIGKAHLYSRYRPEAPHYLLRPGDP